MKDTNDSRPPHASASEVELLPDELLWADGGHASDVVLTALADGQRNIVPTAVWMHVEHCSVCTTHLGHAALLSLHAGAELAAKSEVERATVPRPLPRLPIALGLAVALLGLLPTLLDHDGGLSTVRSFVTRDMPLFVRGLQTLAHRLSEPGSSAGLFLTYAAAVLLVAMAVAVIRILPNTRKDTPR